MTAEPRFGADVLRARALSEIGALVTGAGTGIGRGIALRLAELGANVTGVGRRLGLLEETGARAKGLPGSFTARALDIRDDDAVAETVAEVATRTGLQLLVNNAGGQFYAPATEISQRGWNSVIELNLNAVFSASRHAHDALARDGGAIVNLSLSGVERGGMGMAHSIAARSGVLGLTRTLALEWASDQISVNCIGPGAVLTDNIPERVRAHMRDVMVPDAVPSGHPTEVGDIAELVAFLATSPGRGITGQLLCIDGGAHLGPGLHMLTARGEHRS